MNIEENSVEKKESVASNCLCRIFGNDDRARLKDFDKLALAITDNTGSEPISTEIDVSGRKCSMCKRIELDPSSFMGVTNLYSKSKTAVISLYAYSITLQKVKVEDNVNKLSYNAFEIYLGGHSAATAI